MTEKEFEQYKNAVSSKYTLDTKREKQAKYDKYFLNRCFEAAGMSHCKRLQVGAVAVRDNRTILDGWNGTVPGQNNCCEEQIVCSCTKVRQGMHIIKESCKVCKGTGYISKTKPTVIHAERNIIFYAARKGIPLEGSTMYITHNPCIGCAQAMAAAGITRIVYADDYRSDEGIDFLKQLKIKVTKVEI